MSTPRRNVGRGESPIAIIGMGCMFPGARNLTEFWRVLRRGEDGITDVPPTHWSAADYVNADPKAPDQTYCGRGGFLSPVAFDPTEFGIPPAILEATDTSQLLGLVVAKAALEDAGYGEGRDFNRERISVILGVTGTQELALPLSARLGHPVWRKALREAGIADDIAENVMRKISDGHVGWQENSFPGLLGNVVAGRIANRLNLRGTNCVVDAACASALGAVHLAVLELAAGKCDMVLTGGVDTLNHIFMYMCFSKTTALSPTGDARPFSGDADGTVLGEGVGMLVLKRLADAQRDGDRVYAVISAMGTSSDGRSQSIYAPHSAGQARALRNAYHQAGFGPETVELVEAHGTGTKVGDATEFEALRMVFREAQSDGTWCAIGSVKSQLGHTKAAAGAAGLIKAAMAIYHRGLPPTIKVGEPNPKLGIDESPFYLNTELRPWVSKNGRARRAGVSAFGFGGSNFHAVLEENHTALPEAAWDGSAQIIALSASSVGGLNEQLDEWSGFAGADYFDTAWLAYRAAASRRMFSSSHMHRLIVLVEHGQDVAELIGKAKSKLASSGEEREWNLPGIFYGSGEPQGKIAFLFPGQGSQSVNMGRDLACTFPEMLATLESANATTDDSDRRLSDAIYPAATFSEDVRQRHAAALMRTDIAQPAIGAVSLAMARVLDRFGVKPDMVAGHSYGELVALCVAGRFDAETLHRLSRLRGRLMSEGEGDRGTMLAVRAPLDELARLVEEKRLGVVIANRNAPQQGVLSGSREAIAEAFEACRERGFATKALQVSGAFHSTLMEIAVGPFRHALEAIAFEPSATPVYANTTGKPYPADAPAARELLGQQLVKPVDFVCEIENLYDAGVRTFIEVGPRATLTGLVRSILGKRSHRAIAVDASAGRESGVTDLARVLGQLAAQGHAVELGRWERPAAEPRKPKMVVSLVGANYRADKPAVEARPADHAGIAVAAKSQVAEPRVIQDGPKSGSYEGRGDLCDARAVRTEGTASTSPGPVRAESNGPSRAELSDALQLVQNGLLAMQKLQQQTAEAHQRFLASQEQAHRSIQQLIEGQQRLLAQGSGQRFVTSMPSRTEVAAAGGGRSAPAPYTPVPQARQRDFTAASVSSGAIGREQDGSVADAREARPATKAEAALVTATHAQAPDSSSIESVVLEVVCQKTGYPREMVNLDMDIEADLGVDSIKRVEILAGVEERLPGWPGISPDHLGTIRTLREIVAFIEAGRKESSPATVAAPAVRPQPATAVVEAPATTGSPVGDAEFAAALLSVVAQLTGYPSEMLDLGMDMEADLGIDSIKRVEILAAVEARMPGLPPAKPEYMGSLRTLQEIVDYFCGAGRSSTAAGEPAKLVGVERYAEVTRLTETVATATIGNAAGQQTIQRLVLHSIELPAADEGRLSIAPGQEIWVTDDGAGLSKEITAALEATGLAARLVDPQRPPAKKAALPVGGLIIVAPPVESSALIWEDQSEELLKKTFGLAKALAGDLKAAAANGGSVLATISRMDGAFGLIGGSFDPVQGGLAGLVKTAAKEWPEVRCRAIDVAREWSDAKAAAKAIVRELLAAGPIEVGLTAGVRHGLETVAAAAKAGSMPIAEGDVVVITGGARGVTAEAALALAQACKPRLVLLGRSAEPGAEPGWLTGLSDDAAIKQAILSNEFNGPGRPSPAELQAAFNRHIAHREIRENLGRISAAGAHVEYRCVDIRDASAVRKAIDGIRAQYGPIRGLIHGAGVLEDRRIEDKKPQQFDAVFDTKVRGLRHLLEAISAGELKCAVLFSSVAGRFGNKGQVDYAMANEVLNKVARRMAATMPQCRVVSINWGPWDGGMVSAPLKREFQRQGIELIPLAAGARCLIDEIQDTAGDSIEVVVGGSLPAAAGATSAQASDRPKALPREHLVGPAPAADLRRTPARPAAAGGDEFFLAFERSLDPTTHPFLLSHVLDAHPVLPVAVIMEWLGHAALHATPGLLLHGFDDLRVLKGVVLRDGPVALRFMAAKARCSGSLFDVDVELRAAGPANKGVVHARGTAVLTSQLPTTPLVTPREGLAERPYDRSVDQVYSDVLFHGELFRGIERVEGFSEHGMIARLRTAPPPARWMTEPMRSNWIADPLVLDGSFQIAVLWCFEEMGLLSLPTFVGRYRQYRSSFPNDGVTAVLQVRERSQHKMVGDFAFLDRSGGVVAILEGYECTADASLREAFRRRSIAASVPTGRHR